MSGAARNVIFDLDGTLVDSAPALVEILNVMLAERSSGRRLTIEDIRPLASLGGPALVRGALAHECGDPEDEVEDFRARYRRLSTPAEALYEGVAEGLEDLASHGFRLAICSNKPQSLCEKVMADLRLASQFATIVGGAPDRRAKPAPDLMNLVLAQLGASADDCLYVGDSELDQALAEATGMRFAFMTYGYADERLMTRPLREFHRFPDLVQWIKAEWSAARPQSVAV